MFSSAPILEQKLDTSNKGHQLLQKMGWGGNSGLGRSGQGMVNPIDVSADIRKKNEQYRGVGVRPDPFEAFRLNKSQGYIQRIRDRDNYRDCKFFLLLKPLIVFYKPFFMLMFESLLKRYESRSIKSQTIRIERISQE